MIVHDRNGKPEQFHETGPNQLPGHVRVADRAPFGPVDWPVVQPEHVIHERRFTAGSEEAEKVDEIETGETILERGDWALEDRVAGQPELGQLLEVGQCHG